MRVRELVLALRLLRDTVFVLLYTKQNEQITTKHSLVFEASSKFLLFHFCQQQSVLDALSHLLLL